MLDARGVAWPRRGCLPLLGASPDGLLVWGDGQCEVLEVKCHSPFVDDSGGALRLADGGPLERLAPWHVPQLQLEVLAAGPHCTGAVYVSLSATRGATVLFLPRDDAYTAQLLRLVAELHASYANRGLAPPPDFGGRHSEHGPFLERTLALAHGAVLRAAVPQEAVQRHPADAPLFLQR